MQDLCGSVIVAMDQYGISLRQLFIDQTRNFHRSLSCRTAGHLLHLTCLSVTADAASIDLKEIANSCKFLEMFTLPNCDMVTEEEVTYFFKVARNTLRHLHIYYPVTGKMFLEMQWCTLLETLKVHDAEKLQHEELKVVMCKLTELKTLSMGNQTPLSSRALAISLSKARLPKLICLELAGTDCLACELSGIINVLPLAFPRLMGLRLNNYTDTEVFQWECFINDIVKVCTKLILVEVWGKNPETRKKAGPIKYYYVNKK